MLVTYTFDTMAEDYSLSEHKAVEHAQDMALAIWDIKQYLRDVWKYQEKPCDIEIIRDRVLDILAEYGVTDEVLE